MVDNNDGNAPAPPTPRPVGPPVMRPPLGPPPAGLQLVPPPLRPRVHPLQLHDVLSQPMGSQMGMSSDGDQPMNIDSDMQSETMDMDSVVTMPRPRGSIAVHMIESGALAQTGPSATWEAVTLPGSVPKGSLAAGARPGGGAGRPGISGDGIDVPVAVRQNQLPVYGNEREKRHEDAVRRSQAVAAKAHQQQQQARTATRSPVRVNKFKNPAYG